MFKIFAEVLAFDNEEEVEIIESEDQEEGNNPPVDDAGKPRVFTQAEVDEMIVKRNKSLQQKYATLEKQYQDTLKQKTLTAEERAKTEANLEQLQADMRTTKQQAEHEAKKAREKHERELQGIKSDADFYKSLYERSTIDRSISDAALANDGFAASQFIAYLGPRTNMVEELDSEGKGTKKFTPKVSWEVTNEDGIREMLSLSPSEAVLKMKEDTDNFGNMFKGYVAAGIGAGTAPAAAGLGKRVDPSKVSTEDYMRLAKTPEGRKQLGIGR